MQTCSGLLDKCLIEGAPRPGFAYQLKSIERFWRAQASSHASPQIKRSGHLFSDVLPNVTECFDHGRSRSAARGWQAKFPSVKMGRTMLARSHLELRLLELCEVDGTVLRFVEQPIQIHYVDVEGKARRHTPDVFVEREAGSEFIEVKWERDARMPRNEARWPQIAITITSLGYSYAVITERHVMCQPLAANVAQLLRHRQSPPAPVETAAALRDALTHGGLPLGELVARQPTVPISSVLRALADGWLCTDLTQLIGLDSLIRLTRAGVYRR